MEGSGMKPGSGKDSTYVLEVDKWKFIVVVPEGLRT